MGTKMTRSPISNFRLVCIWVEEGQLWRPMAGGPIPQQKALDTAAEYLERHPDGRTCIVEIKGDQRAVKLSAGAVATYESNKDS